MVRKGHQSTVWKIAEELTVRLTLTKDLIIKKFRGKMEPKDVKWQAQNGQCHVHKGKTNVFRPFSKRVEESDLQSLPAVTWNKMPKSQMETSESWRPKSV
jgi:hypothetical protein